MSAETLATVLMIAGIFFAVLSVALFIGFGFLGHIVISVKKAIGRRKEKKAEEQEEKEDNLPEENPGQLPKKLPKKVPHEAKTPGKSSELLKSEKEKDEEDEEDAGYTSVLKKQETEELASEENSPEEEKKDIWAYDEGADETTALEEGMEETLPLLRFSDNGQNKGKNNGEKETPLSDRSKNIRDSFRISKKIIITHEKEGAKRDAN